MKDIINGVTTLLNIQIVKRKQEVMKLQNHPLEFSKSNQMMRSYTLNINIET